ncbi:SCO family protein [Bosea rubneri]|uniref:SCO family protein n=1 Tax=Bosea rubneri TaxID=3075434 RepID=A0ABU3SEW0_9HYPH|nr:SCO family protein [Bosea sp. ZW T0_25]MDU0343307.1 SCO family protein [Bosea sp. ZW T0_25]
MPILRWIRYTAWTALAVVVFVAAAILLGWWRVDGPGAPGRPVQTAGAPIDVGGPFSLVDHTGRRVTDADFRGKPMLVFFGFTHCPEVCPTTLLDLTNQLKALGPEAERLQVLFITVDPERDTPAQLALYLQSFDPRIVGLSGTVEEVEAAVKAYKAYARKIPTEDSYTMDHTASVYVMDAAGRFRTLIDYHEEAQAAQAKIRLVLK